MAGLWCGLGQRRAGRWRGENGLQLIERFGGQTQEQLFAAGLEGFRRGLSMTAEWFSDPGNLARYRPGSYAV